VLLQTPWLDLGEGTSSTGKRHKGKGKKKKKGRGMDGSGRTKWKRLHNGTSFSHFQPWWLSQATTNRKLLVFRARGYC